jgi:hypothetical protein
LRDSATGVEAILDQIKRLQASVGSPVGQKAKRSYLEAAAVLATIDRPSDLQPVDPTQKSPEALKAIMPELVPIATGSDDAPLALKHDLRRKILKALGSRSKILKALRMNTSERTGIVQTHFEKYVAGTAPAIETQSREELQASLQALTWLDGIIKGTPSLDEVRGRLELVDFLQPFETLAGDDVFRGRAHELDELRKYVGVLPPQTLLVRLKEKFTWGRPDALPALSVSGPGGVGKSALIARFVLEHWRMPAEAKIPFAYLDMDRPSLTVADPATLVDEILRQLVLEFPGLSIVRRIREAFAARVIQLDNAVESAGESGRTSLFRLTLSELLGSLETALGPRPFVVVLDTFEQVQYRGEAQAIPLWDMLAQMQSAWPFLRVVISGRAPVTTLRLASKPPENLKLGDLDRESALAFVKARGIESEEIADAIVRQVGGVPLSLKLAAALLRKAPQEELAIKSRFWIRAADEVIQGQLFDRLLGQISNPEVRRLAHPGLVLRRITPEVIYNVLREPCKLTLRSVEDARELFDLVKREVSLVTGDDPEGALVQRRDLRAVMLKLVIQKDEALAKDVGTRAVSWYAKQTGKRAQAEEAYHRLLLGQSIEKSTIFDADVRASLQSSIAELPLESQRLLATFGLTVDEKILEKASAEERDAALAERVEQLLPHASGLVSAVTLLRERKDPKGDSPLWRSLMRVSIEQGKHTAALEYGERGLLAAVEASNVHRTYELLAEKAWACELAAQSEALNESLRELHKYTERLDDPIGRIQHWMQACRHEGRFSDGNSAGRWKPAIEMFEALSARDLFGVFGATSGFWAWAATDDDLDLLCVSKLLIDLDSPFTTTAIADDRANSAIQSAIRAAFVTRTPDGSANSSQPFAEELANLAACWPYRNLRVHPPESHRAFMALG